MARPSRLSRISVADLNAELIRRQGQAGKLRRRHDELSSLLDGLRDELAALGAIVSSNGSARRGRGRGGKRGPGRPPGKGRRRPRNKGTLVDALASVLKSTTMGVAEAADAVRKAGYKTGSKNFRTMVNIALIKSGKFKRKGRGRYTAKNAG